MTDDGWQARETKRRDRKHEDPAELPSVYIGRSFIVVVSSVSEVDREGTIDATVFRTIKFPISIWLNLVFSYLHVRTIQKSIWPNNFFVITFRVLATVQILSNKNLKYKKAVKITLTAAIFDKFILGSLQDQTELLSNVCTIISIIITILSIQVY